MSKVYDARFEHPVTFYIAGASGSGKTVFLKNLIQNIDFLFKNKIERIVWIYSVSQPCFGDPALKRVEFVKGFEPRVYERNEKPTLIILDDMLSSLGNCQELASYFTTNRHRNLSVAFTSQNLFAKSPVYRTVSLNANIIVLMKMIRDKKQISTFVGQMFPYKKKFAMAAIEQATENPYAYCIIDTRPSTPENLRLRGKIFQEDWKNAYCQEVYIPS